MKKTMLFLFGLLTLIRLEAVEPSEAPSVKTMAINSAVFGMIGFCIFDYVNTKNPGSYSENGMFMSLGLDPKMAVKEVAGDFIFRSGYTFSKNEVYLSSEVFEAIEYYSVGLGYNRTVIERKMTLLAGVEYVVIDRKDEYYPSIGGNVISRYNFNENVSIELNSNLKSRGDNSKLYMFSNYVCIRIKFGNYGKRRINHIKAFWRFGQPYDINRLSVFSFKEI